MKDFRFGLQRVRDLRAHDEDLAKEQLAASLQQRARDEARLVAERARLAASLAPAGLDQRLPASALLARQAWTERLEHATATAQHELRRADSEVAARRVAVGEAARKREALDRLRERRLGEHVAAAARVEAAELDEIALRQFARGVA